MIFLDVVAASDDAEDDVEGRVVAASIFFVGGPSSTAQVSSAGILTRADPALRTVSLKRTKVD
jgi:hypothetical protein